MTLATRFGSRLRSAPRRRSPADDRAVAFTARRRRFVHASPSLGRPTGMSSGYRWRRYRTPFVPASSARRRPSCCHDGANARSRGRGEASGRRLAGDPLLYVAQAQGTAPAGEAGTAPRACSTWVRSPTDQPCRTARRRLPPLGNHETAAGTYTAGRGPTARGSEGTGRGGVSTCPTGQTNVRRGVMTFGSPGRDHRSPGGDSSGGLQPAFEPGVSRRAASDARRASSRPAACRAWPPRPPQPPAHRRRSR